MQQSVADTTAALRIAAFLNNEHITDTPCTWPPMVQVRQAELPPACRQLHKTQGFQHQNMSCWLDNKQVPGVQQCTRHLNSFCPVAGLA
jgi:hypothetical protein